MRREARAALVLCVVIAVGGCAGIQSALAPESEGARRVATLSWVLFGGGSAILALMLALMWLALRGSARMRGVLSRHATVIGGGLVFPIVTLAALLGYGFVLMAAADAEKSAFVSGGEPLHVSVIGERWWWRVVYEDAGEMPIASANEIRVPVGRPVRFSLTTEDVIHSFWVPRLSGKIDMIPGRANTLTISAEKAGVYRGQCAEYCGGAHALMSFYVVALEPSEFEAWISRIREPAQAPQSPKAERGGELFLTNGCGACHTIRGTDADGSLGPDLTHVGSRLSLAAAALPTSKAALARWIAHNQTIKPENLMPPFRNLPAEELDLIATYLEGLK
ncbi:MAG: cytochrome c oxidase subunit II [Hyphomicrobiaceae bacterium]